MEVLFFAYFFLLVMGSPAKRISGSGSFCFGNISIRVEIEDGGRKAKVESSWQGKGGGVGDIGGISRVHVE